MVGTTASLTGRRRPRDRVRSLPSRLKMPLWRTFIKTLATSGSAVVAAEVAHARAADDSRAGPQRQRLARTGVQPHTVAFTFRRFTLTPLRRQRCVIAASSSWEASCVEQRSHRAQPKLFLRRLQSRAANCGRRQGGAAASERARRSGSATDNALPSAIWNSQTVQAANIARRGNSHYRRRRHPRK